MRFFPQLITGASALYPVRKNASARTVMNRMVDGRTVIYSDPDWSLSEWELRSPGLTEDEWNAIEALFLAVGGRFETFTFLDPVGNLLLRSEEFDAPEWNNDPLIAVTPGIDDPFGTTRAMQVGNGSAAAGGVVQTLAVPGDFQYSLSVWARTVGGSSVTLSATTTGGSAQQTFALSSQWERISLAVAMGQATESVAFSAVLDPGETVDLFGMQVDAQLAPSAYRKTADAGGVHAEARFAEDALPVRAQGTDVFDAVIRIISKGS